MNKFFRQFFIHIFYNVSNFLCFLPNSVLLNVSCIKVQFKSLIENNMKDNFKHFCKSDFLSGLIKTFRIILLLFLRITFWMRIMCLELPSNCFPAIDILDILPRSCQAVSRSSKVFPDLPRSCQNIQDPRSYQNFQDPISCQDIKDKT